MKNEFLTIDLTNSDDKHTKIIGNFGDGVTAIILEPTDLMRILENERKQTIHANQ